MFPNGYTMNIFNKLGLTFSRVLSPSFMPQSLKSSNSNMVATWEINEIDNSLTQPSLHFVTSNICLCLLLCCTNKHINAFCIKRHNKAVHTIDATSLPHPLIQHFTLIPAKTYNNRPMDNNLPCWLLSCTCFPHIADV